MFQKDAHVATLEVCQASHDTKLAAPIVAAGTTYIEE